MLEIIENFAVSLLCDFNERLFALSLAEIQIDNPNNSDVVGPP
jgi:hypothetical protein